MKSETEIMEQIKILKQIEEENNNYSVEAKHYREHLEWVLED